MSFIGISYRNVGEVLLKRAAMTQRQLHHHIPPQHGDSAQTRHWELTVQPTVTSTY